VTPAPKQRSPESAQRDLQRFKPVRRTLILTAVSAGFLTLGGLAGVMLGG
jgi:hypothetical protein